MPNNNHDDGITIPTSPVDGLVQRLQEETRERGQSSMGRCGWC